MVSFFNGGQQPDKFGVLIHLGGGGASVAIIHSKVGQSEPEIVWSYKDQVSLKNVFSLDKSLKLVMGALLNALIKLEGEGRSALGDYKPGAKMTNHFMVVSAPWSYTISRKISYVKDEPFEITESLINSLIEKVSIEAFEDTPVIPIARLAVDLKANGYSVSNLINRKAKEVSLTETIVAIDESVNTSLEDLKEKVLPDLFTQTLSHMVVLYCTYKEMYPDYQAVCIVDVTNEATELGLVRENVLGNSIHIPVGSFSLAREVANILSVPLMEGYAHLPNLLNLSDSLTLSKNQQSEIDKLLEGYIKEFQKMFTNTGDELSIPKTIILHADKHVEEVYSHLIKKAAYQVIKSEPTIKTIVSDLEKKNKKVKNDATLYLNAKFFHKRTVCLDFEYL